MLDRNIERIVDDALAGKHLSKDDALQLLKLDPSSAEAAYIRWASITLGREASNNCGQIYAQIGLDASPCPRDCAFCGLASCNSNFTGKAEVPLEDIVSYARTFQDAGIHLVSLMATDVLPFERYLEIVQAVREATDGKLPIMANCGDLTFEQARQLKEHGVSALYHANRLGEGEITRIDPAARVATMEAAKTVGLKLMTAVEPVTGTTPLSLIAERMWEVIAFKPYCAGVGALTVVPGKKASELVPVKRTRTAHYACVMRLAAGTSIPFGTGCGNVLWVDAGTNPRGRTLPTESNLLERDTHNVRKQLQRSGWDVPAQPLKSWFA